MEKHWTFRANVRQLNSSGSDEFQSFVYILRFLHSHARVFVVSTQRRIACKIGGYLIER